MHLRPSLQYAYATEVGVSLGSPHQPAFRVPPLRITACSATLHIAWNVEMVPFSQATIRADVLSPVETLKNQGPIYLKMGHRCTALLATASTGRRYLRGVPVTRSPRVPVTLLHVQVPGAAIANSRTQSSTHWYLVIEFIGLRRLADHQKCISTPDAPTLTLRDLGTLLPIAEAREASLPAVTQATTVYEMGVDFGLPGLTSFISMDMVVVNHAKDTSLGMATSIATGLVRVYGASEEVAVAEGTGSSVTGRCTLRTCE